MADLGTDFAGVTDLSPGLDLVSGRLCLAQNLARRLLMTPGAFLGSGSYGGDMAREIGDTPSPWKIAARAEDQLLEDERVDAASVDASFDPTTGKVELACSVDEGNGPFDFIVTTDGLTVDLLMREVS